MQNRPLAIILIISTLVPVLVVGWLSMRLMGDSETAANNQHRELQQLKMNAVQNSLLQRFDAIEAEILRHQNNSNMQVAEVKSVLNNSPMLQHILLIDVDGKVRFPRRDSTNTEDRAVFERWDMSLNSGDLLNATRVQNDVMAAEPDYSLSRRGNNYRTANRSGWYTWYWGQALRHALWLHSDGQLKVFELNPQYLRADLIGVLPDTSVVDIEQYKLFDERGDILYQWGSVDADWVKQGGMRMEQSLPAPLASWRLQYTGPGPAQIANQRWLYAVMLSGLLLLLGAVSVWLYREQTRAARLSRQRVSFVNQVSHELKTPLTNVRLYAELADQSLDDEQDHPARNYLQVINEESERLSRLVNNVLSYAREQRGKIELRYELLCPDEVVRSVSEAFRPQLAKRNIELTLSLAASEKAQFDRDVLEQVLGNLLSNAEKYASAGNRVDLRTFRDANKLHIVVRDYGPGIAKAMQERIFVAFERLSDQVNEGSSGTGIGLHIVRSLCELHGGDVKVRNANPGAEFEATFKESSDEYSAG